MRESPHLMDDLGEESGILGDLVMFASTCC